MSKRVGKTIAQIHEGDSLTVTETIEQRDILLYLGVTNDNNPLYLQDTYTETTEYHKPIVPPIILTGLITSAVSRLLPGPGSNVVNMSLNFIEPIKHNSTVTLSFTVIKVDPMKEVVTLSVEGHLADGDQPRILDAMVMVKPPKPQANLGTPDLNLDVTDARN